MFRADMGELTIGALIRGWLLNLPVVAGVMAGGWAILEYTPGAFPSALLALIGFGIVWGFVMYRVTRRWWPQSAVSAPPLVSLSSDVVRTIKLLSLVALFSVVFALGSVSLFLYTPGPLATDLIATLGFTTASAFGTYAVIRRRWPPDPSRRLRPLEARKRREP